MPKVSHTFQTYRTWKKKSYKTASPSGTLRITNFGNMWQRYQTTPVVCSKFMYWVYFIHSLDRQFFAWSWVEVQSSTADGRYSIVTRKFLHAMCLRGSVPRLNKISCRPSTKGKNSVKSLSVWMHVWTNCYGPGVHVLLLVVNQWRTAFCDDLAVGFKWRRLECSLEE